MEGIVCKLNYGLDIKATDEGTIQSCVEQYGVAPGEEERLLYEDNCKGDCERKRWCGSVDTALWRDAAKRKAKKEASGLRAEKRAKRISEDQQKLEKLKKREELSVESYSDGNEYINDEIDDTDDYAPCSARRNEGTEEPDFP